MADINKIIVTGKVRFQPELKALESKAGKKFNVCLVALEVETPIKTKEGTRTARMFIDVKFFGREAEQAASSLSVGDTITVEGRLKYEEWTSKTGEARFKHVIAPDNIIYPESIQPEVNLAPIKQYPQPRPKTMQPQPKQAEWDEELPF